MTATRPKAKAKAPKTARATGKRQEYPSSESIGLLMRIALFGLRASFKEQLTKHGVPWSAYYYLRVLVVMYMNEPGEATLSIQPVSAGIGATLWVAAVGTLLLGIFPSALLNFATSSSALNK